MSDSDRWGPGDILRKQEEERRLPLVTVTWGMTLTHRLSGAEGTVVAFTEGQRIVLEGGDGRRFEHVPRDGHFAFGGRAVGLRGGGVAPPRKRNVTASGSYEPEPQRARVARGGRIWVEGIHDAELIEAIWGDDLRTEGVVVEPLHGADDLVTAVRSFAPGPDRRLGVLLDHLVAGSKESAIAARVDDPAVLILGHPYIDIWQAIRPAVVGIDSWPTVPRGRPWKDGVLTALGFDEGEPGRFWQRVLAQVTSYHDVETPLVNSVERLIDFVTVDND